MWFWWGTTLTASFFDSLNPSAIAQQMLLQAMVKKKRHIWFFISGIGTANLIMGLAIYYGIATWVSKFLTKIVNAYPLYVYGVAIIAGIALLAIGIQLIIKTKQSNIVYFASCSKFSWYPFRILWGNIADVSNNHFKRVFYQRRFLEQLFQKVS